MSMDLIGKTTIDPVLFYSGKISGYITWVVLLLLIVNVKLIGCYTIFYNIHISYLFLIAGLILIVISLFNLGRSTRLGLPEDDTTFVSGGLYRFSRNPMYTGFNLLTVSSILYTLNIWILLAGIYSIVVYHFIIIGEEKFLINRFGDQYTGYLRKVRRYF